MPDVDTALKSVSTGMERCSVRVKQMNEKKSSAVQLQTCRTVFRRTRSVRCTSFTIGLRAIFRLRFPPILRTVVEIALENIAQVTYAEFLNNVSDPDLLRVDLTEAAGWTGRTGNRSGLVFPMIDRLLGGAGRPMTNVRPMTEIEQRIIQGVLKFIVDNLKESWRPVYAIDSR